MAYTIQHRKHGERKCYGFGYHTDNLDMLREVASSEAQSGDYACVKIVDANTLKVIECFTKAHR